MRFDGYYILSDALELPNLATHGQQSLMKHAQRWGLGLKSTTQLYPEAHDSIFLLYGIAAFCWRIVICMGLLFVAESLFAGVGIILAIISFVLWVVLPVFKLIIFIFRGTPTVRPSKIRFVMTLLVIATAIGSTFTIIPWWGTESAPAVVDYFSKTEVRSSANGFVVTWDVKNGETVEAGAQLGLLRNAELEKQHAELKAQIALAEHRASQFLFNQQMAAWDVAQEMNAALQSQLNDLEQQLESLVLRAPCSGVVLLADEHEMVGQYIRQGELVAAIGAAEEQCLIALIDQTQFPVFDQIVGKNVQVYLTGYQAGWQSGDLIKVEPQATRSIPHLGLTAATGSPLDIRKKEVAERTDFSKSDDLRGHSASDGYELVTPHFRAYVSIPERHSSIRIGHPAWISTREQGQTLGNYISAKAKDWYRDRTARIRDQWYR